MNIDYIPIIGERKGNDVKLNIVSFTNATLSVLSESFTQTITLKKYTCSSVVIKVKEQSLVMLRLKVDGGRIITNSLSINSPVNPFDQMHVFNCDCHFLPETGLWETVDTSKSRYAFHTGDQIYFDEAFIECCKLIENNCCSESATDTDLIEIIYETAKVALLRKANVLQKFYNIMLGDDHDICDELLRKKYSKGTTERVVILLRNAYNDIQSSLRLSNADVVTYGTTKILLIDNIRSRSDQDYADYLLGKLNNLYGITDSDTLYIMSPRVPMNNDISCCTTCCYGKETNDVDYKSLYAKLLSLKAKQIKIFCGDEHIARSFSIGSKCELHFVGTMNSVLDGYDSRDYLIDFETKRLYNNKEHSYMIIDNGNAYHVTKSACCNSWFGWLFYCCKAK